MVTISNTDFKSDMRLCNVFNVVAKDKIVGTIIKLGEYISPNLKKGETAVRAADIILHNPLLVLDDLNKNELQLVKEFVAAGSNVYVERKMRKTFYKLQKYNLVLTYEDNGNQVWKMLMPDEVREAFARHIGEAMEYKELYPHKLSSKERAINAFLSSLNTKDTE